MQVKVNHHGNFQPSFHTAPTSAVTEEDLARSLAQLTMPHVGQPLLTVEQLQRTLAIGQSTAYQYVTTGRLPAHYYVAIAHQAFALGDTSLVALMLPAGYTLQPLECDSVNGDLKDDEIQVINATDEARVACERGDMKNAMNAVDRAKRAVGTIEAEVMAKKK